MSNLFNKYKIKKTDGSPVDPKAEYFVLRLDTDPAARYAVIAYADFIRQDDPESGLARDLYVWVKRIREEQNG